MEKTREKGIDMNVEHGFAGNGAARRLLSTLVDAILNLLPSPILRAALTAASVLIAALGAYFNLRLITIVSHWWRQS